MYVDRSCRSDPGTAARLRSCHVGFNAGTTPACHQGLAPSAQLIACNDCHGDVAQLYKASFHGDSSSQGPRQGPLCGDCHDAHDIVPPGTKEFRAQQMVMCGRATRTPEDLHGQLPRQGLPARLDKTAVCSECHSGHKILPASNPESTVSRQNVVATCRRCHPGANENFADFRCT